MTKKRALLVALVIAVIAVLFPPWGFMGQDFDHFGFAFRNRPMLSGEYDTVSASIAWHLLGLELAAIALLGAIAYVLAPPQKAETLNR